MDSRCARELVSEGKDLFYHQVLNLLDVFFHSDLKSWLENNFIFIVGYICVFVVADFLTFKIININTYNNLK